MIIDFHYHYLDNEGFIDNLLFEMEECGIEKTMLMGLSKDVLWEVQAGSNEYSGFLGNEEVSAAVKEHPDKFIGCVYIDPREKGFLDTFEKYYYKGFKCAKIWPPIGFYPDEEKLFPLYEKLEKYDIPLLAHAGLTNNKMFDPEGKRRVATDSRCAHPLVFDYIARLFPEMKIIIAHMAHPYNVEAWCIQWANPNVYLDISGGDLWTNGAPLIYSSLGREKYVPIDFSRVIWGSDNTHSQKVHFEKSRENMYKMGASDEDMINIFGATAKKILKL